MKNIILIVTLFMTCFSLNAQLSSSTLVGYWHYWNINNAPYIVLDQIDSRGNVIEATFADEGNPATVFQNPTQELIYVTGKEGDFYQIIDSQEQVVKEGILDNSCSIVIRDLPPGVYIIRWDNQTDQFMKMNF